MALLHDDLSLWEIGFRWTGRDPDALWLRIPLEVRDHFRTLMDSILHSRLDCFTLVLEKWDPENGDPELKEFHIRYHLNAVEDCAAGTRFDRKLLKWARIERWALAQWCERQGVPLPEFWFPPGWKLDYEWPGEEVEDDQVSPGDTAGATGAESSEDRRQRIDARHRVQMACQQMALRIWAKEPTRTIKELANRKEILNLIGEPQYEQETIEGWLGEVDPRNPARKRGRKRKINSGSGNTQ